MPGAIDGITLARETQRLRPALPVLLTTGYSEDLAAIEGLRMLPKPYRIEEFAAAIWNTLKPAN